MNKKNQSKKQNTQKNKYEDVPTFTSPTKTTWGKIVILIIAAAMVLSPLIALIVTLITE